MRIRHGDDSEEPPSRNTSTEISDAPNTPEVRRAHGHSYITLFFRPSASPSFATLRGSVFTPLARPKKVDGTGDGNRGGEGEGEGRRRAGRKTAGGRSGVGVDERRKEGRQTRKKRPRARARHARGNKILARQRDVCLFDIHSPLQPTLFASPAAATDLTR